MTLSSGLAPMQGIKCIYFKAKRVHLNYVYPLQTDLSTGYVAYPISFEQLWFGLVTLIKVINYF